MKLYPHNPHYLSLRDKPLLLIGSGEHYGAVLNTDFDYVPYLDTMARDGLNQCRVFSGTYREVPGEFGIVENTLAPRPEAYLAPWKHVGDKWDLSEWNPAYWHRLRDFCTQTQKRNVVVEYVLFCFWYNDNLWHSSPMHPANNVQGVGPQDRERVYALAETELLRYQEEFVKKAIAELTPFDNVYVELCNEPYTYDNDAMYDDWHRHLSAIVHRADPHRLIAVNYRNQIHRIENLDPHVSICNFHYTLPQAVQDNYHLHRVIADDETGFAGQSDAPYRKEAWRFLLSGGSIFSHLDYSFTTAHPDGTAPILGNTPGYGSAELRQQFGFLRRFLEAAEVWNLQPVQVETAPQVKLFLLGKPGARYIGYMENVPAAETAVAFPFDTTDYIARWFDPITQNELPASPKPDTTPTGHSGELALLLTHRTNASGQ